MFKIGKLYEIVVYEDDEDTTYMGCKVLAVENTLIEIEHPGGDRKIYNTAALTFISATEEK